MGKSLLFVCLMPLAGLAQSFSQLAGGRSAGLAHSSVALQDVWSVCHNQAAMTAVDGTEVGISYEKRYFLRDINLVNFALTRSVGQGALGLSFGFLGFDSYGESSPGLAYAHSFGQHFSMGVKLAFDMLSVNETGARRSQINSALGILLNPTDELRLGLHLDHFNSAWLDEENVLYPMTLRLGLAYDVSEHLLLTGELLKQLGRTESIRAGLEYLPAATLALRIGVATAPYRQSLGLGYDLGAYQVNLSFDYLQALGGTANLSLQIAIP